MVEEALRDAIQQLMPTWGYPVWHHASSVVSLVQRYPLWTLGGGVAGLLGLGALLCAHPKAAHDIFGDAAFATRPDVKKAGLLEPTGKVIGEFQGEPLYAPWESNVLVMGPPGYGKTAGCVLPTMDFDGDLVVLALKASLVTRTKALRAAKGPTYIFEPTSPSTTDRFDLFRGIPFGTRGEIAGCQELAQHLSEPPAPVSSAEGGHYDRVTTHILAAVALYVGLTQDHPSVPSMLRFLSSPGMTVVELLQQMDKLGHRTLCDMIGRLRKETASRLATDWLAAIEWLTVWDDPDLAYAMSGDTIPWTELQESHDPMTIYLRISAMDAKRRLQGVVRTILCAILAHLTKRDPTKPRRPLLVILDDAAELERLTIVQSIAAFGREYGINLMIVFQSPMQVWSSYGKLSSLFNTCDTWVIYPQNDPDSSAYLSRKGGTYTAEIPTETIQSGGGMGHRRSRSTRLVERPLLLEHELSDLGEDEVLICHRKLKIRGKWRNAYADTRFAGTA